MPVLRWTTAAVGFLALTLTAGQPAVAADTTSSVSASAAMPTGDLPGWKQVFADDFDQATPRGSFPGPYAGRWSSYDGFPDTLGLGSYDQDIISAHDGRLDLYLHAENGVPLTAAPVPWVNGSWGGQTYGRFSVRMKTDNLSGYGASFLLWPDSGNWNDGEVDFPESALDDVVKGYSHCPGHPADNCLWTHTSARYTDWHTYTVDWTPSRLTLLVDDNEVASTTSNIPDVPMHWVMQFGTTNRAEAVATSGHVLLDWATVYRRA